MSNFPHAPAIFAHRGASALAPENTLAAFRRAVEIEADGIELDVTLSADGVVVVIHDDSLDRTTDGSGPVSGLTAAELKELDAGSWFGPEFTGEPIPTLEEVLAEIGRSLIINIEIKSSGVDISALAQNTAELVQKYQLDEVVLFSSFSALALEKVGGHLPQARAALVAMPSLLGLRARCVTSRRMELFSLNPHYIDVSRRSLARAHRRGLKVIPWTVNKEKHVRRLTAWGVDGIIMDDPRLGLRIKQEAGA